MKSLSRLMALAALAGGLAAVPASGQVVISQVFGVPTGGNGGSTYAYEVDFIELFNRGNTPVDMTGWSVQPEWLGDWEVIPLSGTLQPGQYFLIQVYERQPDQTNTGAPLPTPDLIAQAVGGGFNNPDSTWLSGSYGGVALMSNTVQLPADTCPESDPALLDLVSWGSSILVNCGTGATNAPSQSNFLAVTRKNGGCTDTGSSIADFELKTPNPRNTTMVFPFYAAVSAVPAAPGASTKFTASISPFVCGATATLSTAVADLSSIGGSASATLFDNGTNGDLVSGDGTFSLDYTLPGAVVTGQYAIPVTLTDVSTNVRVVNAALNVAIVADTCQTAKPIASFPQTEPITATNFTDDPFAQQCSTSSPTVGRYGTWYSITPASDLVMKVTKSISTYTIGLYTGSCTSPTLLDCDDSNLGANFRLTAGVPYKVLITYDNTGTPTGSNLNPTFSFNTVIPAANDICQGAIDLNVQGLPAGTYSDTNVQAFLDGGSDIDNSCDSIAARTHRGVWYTYLPPQDSVLRMNESVSGFNTVNSLWTGTCPDGLTQVGCSTVENNSYPVVAGQRYYVLIGLNSSASPGTTSTYNNTFSVSIPPANDVCANATDLGTLSSAFLDTPNLGASSADTSACGAAALGVWYKFTPPQNGALRLNESITSTGADVSWAVVSGCVGGTSLLCSTTDTNQLVSTPAGQTVYILLYGSVTTTTTLLVEFSFIPAPTNDVCTGAEVIGGFPHNAQPDARAAIATDIDVGSCSTQTSTAYGLWYTLTAPFTGLLTVGETTSAEGDIGVWSVSNPMDPCNTMTQIGCETDDAGVFSVVQGTTYLILVGNSTSASPSRPTANYNINFNMVLPYANDNCSGAQVISSLPVLDLTLPTFYADSGPRVSCQVVAATVHNHSLWYAYTPATDETITIWDTSASKSLAIAVFKDSCSAAEEACGTNDVTFNLDAGHTYYIVVGTNLVSPDSSTGQYRLNFVRSQRFTNDVCADATPITQTPFNTIIDLSTATTDAVPALPCSSNIVNVPQGAWYKIQTQTAGQLSGSIEVDYARANSGVGALFRSLDGTCGNLDPTPLICATDPTSVPLVIDLTANLDAATTYYLIVGLPASSSDDFVISIDNVNYTGTLDAGAQFCCRGTTCASVPSGTCTGSVAGSSSVVLASCGAGNSSATCCFADFNHTGGTTIDDLFLYLNAYFTSSPYANFGGDTVANPTIDDLFLYINAYFTGCQP